MSKASEWARAYQAAYGPGGAPDIWITQTNMRTPSQRFLVGPSGDLEMGGWSMDCEEARKFARWILDTFEDMLLEELDAVAQAGRERDEEIAKLREMHQEVLRDNNEEYADFAKALGLPEYVSENELQGYPHILTAIKQQAEEIARLRAAVSSALVAPYDSKAVRLLTEALRREPQ